MIERYTREQMAKIWTDEKKFSLMLEVELLVAEAQAKILRQIPEDAPVIMRRLAKIDVDEIKKIEEQTNHDIVAFIQCVSKSLGEYAKYLHKGLTSNDLNDTVFAVQIKEASGMILSGIEELMGVISKRAIEFKDLLCIGRTHGVHAEPMSFGLKFALFYDELSRAKRRFEVAVDEVCVGKISGAVGNFAYNPPEVEEYVCEKLGIRPAGITTQVVPRDRHAAYFSALAILASCMERFATEIRHLQRTEVLEVEENFAKGQKGSSAMPHKRNPILSERLCGQARLIRSYLISSLENISLWHERDISHSSVERIIFPDATILMDYMLSKMKNLVEKLNVYPEKIACNLQKTNGLIFSQAILSALMDKGVERMVAYGWVQENALKSWEENKDFLKLIKDDKRIKKYLTDKEIEEIFSVDRFMKYVDYIYERVGIK